MHIITEPYGWWYK